MYTGLENHFGRTRWNSYVTRLKWNLVSVRLEIVLVSVQDRCTVCAKQGSEIISTEPIELLDDEAQVKSHFGLFGYSVSISAR